MDNFNQKPVQISQSKKNSNPMDEVKLFFMGMPDKDKLAYGLIAIGVIFVIIGIILW